MKIGIISDTHDDMDRVARVVDYVNEKCIEHLLHAGDMCSPFAFEVLGNLGCPITGIFGNNDGDRVLLMEKSKGALNVQPHSMKLDGKRIVIIHEPREVDALADSGHFDLVVYGHSHKPDIRRQGGALVVNPGKVARLHKGKSTMAVLETEGMEAEIIELTD